jgi:predicted transport protein
MPSPEDMLGAVSASILERTGRSMDDWVALVGASGVDPLDQNAVRHWLRDVHSVGQNTQWAIADRVATRAGWVRPTVEQYVEQQYTGTRAALRPVFEAVHAAALALGDDVRTEGRTTYVPFVRGRQFAAVAAATATRVDLGLRLPEPPSGPAGERLRPAKAPGQATHKVALASVEDVDDDVRALLRAAYEQSP